MHLPILHVLCASTELPVVLLVGIPDLYSVPTNFVQEVQLLYLVFVSSFVPARTCRADCGRILTFFKLMCHNLDQELAHNANLMHSVAAEGTNVFIHIISELAIRSNYLLNLSFP